MTKKGVILISLQQLQDAYESVDLPVTMASLRSIWIQLSTGLKYTSNEVENQILTRDSKGLSKSQLDDLRRCFNHFDKDKTGSLECPEFKACLVSVGHTLVAEDKQQVGVSYLLSHHALFHSFPSIVLTVHSF